MKIVKNKKILCQNVVYSIGKLSTFELNTEPLEIISNHTTDASNRTLITA
jgi:hypothetical protein